MTVEALIASLEARGVVLQVEGDHLDVDAPKGALSPRLVGELRKNKSAIINFIKCPDLPKYLSFLSAYRDEAAPDGGLLLPPPPPLGLSRTEHGAAWAAWWNAVEQQRERGVQGKARYPYGQ